MITKIYGKLVAVCDGGCDETLETETGDFQAALEVLRNNQWAQKKVDGTWQHFCGECRDKL